MENGVKRMGKWLEKDGKTAWKGRKDGVKMMGKECETYSLEGVVPQWSLSVTLVFSQV